MIYGNEDFVEVVDWSGGVKLKATFFHKFCLEKDKEKKDMLTLMVGNLAQRSMRMLDRMEREDG